MPRIKITLHRVALRIFPKRLGHSVIMESLANILYTRFEELGAISDFDEALALQRNALELRPRGYPRRAHSLANIAEYLYLRFTLLDTLSDLDEALALQRNALGLLPQGHPDRASFLGVIADYHLARFTQLDTLFDLDEALGFQRSALELHPEGHPNRVLSLADIARYLHTRFKQLGMLSDLDEALALQRRVLELRPEGHPDRVISLGHIAGCLHSRFMRLGAMSDLDEALSLERSALELYPQGDIDRFISLHNIANYLFSRFNQLGMISDLDDALSLERSVLEHRPQGHRYRVLSLGNIANYLFSRFVQLGALSDLDEALALHRNVLELRPEGHPDRPGSLSSVALCLHRRFTHLGTLSDLDEAIALERNALELRPQRDPDRAIPLGNIASYLHSRFLQCGVLSDLDEALVFQHRALELRPEGHLDRAIQLGNIANLLYSRFKHLGTLSDLNEALVLQRKVLDLRPKEHPIRPIVLGNIATYLHARFMQLEMPTDLNEALDLYRSSSELLPQGHSQRAVSLGNIANCLHLRFKRSGTASDLDEALSVERSALELCPQGHPFRTFSMGNIANYLHSRFTHLGTLSDLDEAVSIQRDALELRPEGHPDRADSLDHLADYLHTRFTHLETLSDLDTALSLRRSALELRPVGDPLRGSSLGSLAHCLQARFKHHPVHDTSDLRESFELYSQLSSISQTVSSADIQCAKEWIQAAEEREHDTTMLAYKTFLRLSAHHLAALPSLPRNIALFKQLVASLAIDALSAGVRYGNPVNAVEFIEQGRGVFWSQLIRLRSPLDEVAASGESGKRLADQFTQLATVLRSVLDGPSGSQGPFESETESQHHRACHLNTQLQDLVAEIRRLPGLSHFLQPPLFSNLRVAAAAGPVIILNASQYACDALVLLSDKDPVHVALQTKKADVSELLTKLHSLIRRAKSMPDMTKEFQKFLRELWETVVSPIAEVLQGCCPPRSRIWWCPTAEFSLLPLHAAAPCRKGQKGLPDLYTSSYTPTLTALVRARQTRPSDSSVEQQRFLIVGQAQAPGQKALTSVNTELSNISERMSSIAALTCIQDRDATIAKVGEELGKNDFAHLACHGVPDRKHPFESGFVLHDGRLKVENIMRYDLQNAKFAYLSACHTTAGDEESPDEVIHLAAAMQFAGFRSVIGTMWAVEDAHTNEITSKFYGNLVDESGRLDHTRAALALHRTLRGLRSSNVPLDQLILYIHIGA